MTVPASNAVVIFMMTSHVCRAITMPGCRMHSTVICQTTPNLRKHSLIVALRQDSEASSGARPLEGGRLSQTAS